MSGSPMMQETVDSTMESPTITAVGDNGTMNDHPPQDSFGTNARGVFVREYEGKPESTTGEAQFATIRWHELLLIS
jgi:hypothetical protein